MRIPPIRPVLWRAVLTCLACVASGLLSLPLIPSTEHAAPLYLASGVGLACVLGWGRVMLAPVALSAGIVMAAIALAHQPPLTPLTLTGLVLASAIGAAVQTWLGWRLTARLRDANGLALDRPADIVRFLVLAGPVACLVLPTCLTLGWSLASPGTAMDLARTWSVWWAGCTLGVLVGTPMALSCMGRPADLWRQRRLQVGLPLLLATLVLGVAVRQVHDSQREREHSSFVRDATRLNSDMRLHLQAYSGALEALHGLFVASNKVDREEFAHATRHWLGTLGGVQALGWNERVDGQQLAAFEAAQRAAGLPHYRVVNGRNSQPPARNAEIVALRYVEPHAGNERVLGHNVLSIETTREAFDLARREGRAQATAGFRLIQDVGEQMGVVVYLPVYDGLPTTPLTRVQLTRGAVFMTLRMGDVLAHMNQAMPPHLRVCLLDAPRGQPPVRLAGHGDCVPSAAAQAQGLVYRNDLGFAGRTWSLLVWPSERIAAEGLGQLTWLLLSGAVLLAAALTTLLLTMTGHARRIEAAAQEARRQRAAAERANEAKSAFLSRMSHELRTPLNAVLGFAQVMELDARHPLSDTQRRQIQQIQQAGWHLLDLIDDVLDLSNIDSGRLQLNLGTVSVHDAVTGALALVADEAAARQITVRVVGNIPADWQVRADGLRLRQVLHNLLINGIRYNQAGGEVSVQVRREAGSATGTGLLSIAVQDTGWGMTPAQQAELFQPFNRLGREASGIDGAGIGLVISRHLVTLMNGHLQVASDEGRGSTFTVVLPQLRTAPAAHTTTSPTPAPVVPETPPRPHASEVASSTAQTGPASHAENTTTPPAAPVRPDPTATPRVWQVLCVEDNAANSDVIRQALQPHAHLNVRVAASIEEGLGILHNRLFGPSPDLVLLDVHLPDASGIEMLSLIKANPETVGLPVIMISADATPERIDAALAGGAYCYLTKPVQVPELLRQIDLALGH